MKRRALELVCLVGCGVERRWVSSNEMLQVGMCMHLVSVMRWWFIMVMEEVIVTM